MEEGFSNKIVFPSAEKTHEVNKIAQTDFAANTSRNKRTSKPGLRKAGLILIIVAAVIVILGILSVFTIVFPAKKVLSSARVTYFQARMALDAVKKQNIALASSDLLETQTDLSVTQSKLKALSFLRFLPVAAGYYSDASHLMQAGTYGLQAATVLVNSIKPYADVLGLKGKSSFVSGSASQRIQVVVETMGKITPRIDAIASDLSLAKEQIDLVNPNHYPAFLGGKKIKTELQYVKTLTDEGVTVINSAKPLIKILPNLLGDPAQQKYLVLFQNDKELRPTGGFITAYAIFSLNQGVITVDASNNIYSLDATIPNKPVAPRPILEYLPGVPQFNIRDSNLSPDFLVSMQTFMQMYRKSSEYAPVNGIIAVDTQALVSAINILGNVEADGTIFTSQNDPSCECPQVIYALEQASDQRVNYIKQNRKGIIGDLMYAIMYKALSSSPKLYWGKLFQAILTDTSQKHILFDIFNSQAQKGIKVLDAAGQVLPFKGDYLNINEANFGGDKANLYVSETVTQNYVKQKDNSIIKTVTINWKNPYPPSDCNLADQGLCLNGPYKDWFRLYVPEGSQPISSSGSETKLLTYTELGKTVFEGFLTVRPQGIASFTITYRLPFKVSSSNMPLLIQKEPGTGNTPYGIEINGAQTQSFTLSTDKQVMVNF